VSALRRRPHRTDGEAGSTDALGLALLAPAAIALAVVIVFLGRNIDGRATAHTAAEAAAQAAAQERSPAAAISAARAIGTAMLVDHTSCSRPSVQVDTSGFRPGGRVRVTVSCTASTAGLELIGPQRAEAMTATAIAPVDPFRSTEEGP
jgi:hypothetical protein